MVRSSTAAGIRPKALSSALRVGGEEGRPIVEAAVRQLETDIASLRAIIADLRPASLDELGLEPALRTLVERVTAPAGLAATLDVDVGDARLDPDVETIAYRVAQEALTNVVKHARATKVNISLRLVDGELRLSVVDDGRGLEPRDDESDPDRDRSGGYGIVGMHERAALGNGQIEIGPARDRGTAVRLIIPAAR